MPSFGALPKVSSNWFFPSPIYTHNIYIYIYTCIYIYIWLFICICQQKRIDPPGLNYGPHFIYTLESSARFARASGPGLWWGPPLGPGPSPEPSGGPAGIGPSPGPSPGPCRSPAGIGLCRGPYKYVHKNISNVRKY